MIKRNCYWLEEVSKDDTPLVGGKGANLGEMIKNGFPVPSGFVVSASAYENFLTENGLLERMKEILNKLDVSDPQRLVTASVEIKKLIRHASVPERLAFQIRDYYSHLSKRASNENSGVRRILSKVMSAHVPVAVRSSATSEDSKDASFAGQNETYLNVSGEDAVIEAVRDCWASLFEARSIFYRVQQKIDHFSAAIAVVVQAMIPSEASGIVFSIDPVTNNKNRIIVEVVWGLGEYIVQGKVTPDHFEVNKSDLFIVNRQFVDQKIMLVRDRIGNKEAKVSRNKISKHKLTDEQIRDVAALSKKLEEHYLFPQDSEFAMAQGKVYLVQTRPITTTVQTKKEEVVVPIKSLEEMDLLCSGAPASPGIHWGPAKVLKSAKEIGKILPGDVLVAPQTNPDFVPAMKKATAIVTDKGGRTSHAAIVSRELGIPCVVGTENATKKIRTGQVVTVNGAEGKVFAGAPKIVSPKTDPPSPKPSTKHRATKGEMKTITKVYVNLAEPDLAKDIAARNCDGVGLLRAEFMLAGIGTHPKKIIEEGKQKEFTQDLANNLATFAQSFYPRPVIYRATDFKTNEYRSLKGGEKFEPHEENPMIGFRGAYRYIVQPEVFKMEIQALKHVREELGFKNLWLMIPFVRTVKELEDVKSLISLFGLQRSASFKLLMMAEIPANVILLDKFIEAGIDGVSIGSNDLTMLTLGVDRDNENVASEYSELNEAVLWSLEKVCRTCKKYGVSCSICGQAPSDYPELTEKLVEWGATSVSVNPDVIEKTREIVYEAEEKLLMKDRK